VIAGAVGQAHAVDVAFDESWHDSPAPQVDDLRIRRRSRGASDCCEAAIADRHHGRDAVSGVHRVNATVDECQIARGSARRRSLREDDGR
jgi:hypothetical protein